MAAKKQNEIQYGACRYCGQINSENGEWETQEEADEYATMECDCHQAIDYQREIAEKNRKEEERQQTFLNARMEIEELFGGEAEKCGLMSIDDDLKDLMWRLAAKVYDEKFKSVAINITPGMKAKISMTTGGKLVITRSDSASLKREV